MSVRLHTAVCAASVLVTLATPAIAQPDPAPPAPQPEGPPSPPPRCTGALDVHIVDATTHEPVGVATVRVGDRVLDETDDVGRCSLRNLCPGQFVLVIERPDYRTATLTVQVPGPSSVEVHMTTLGDEVIVVEEAAPDPPDMRSATTLSGEALERTRGRSFSESLSAVAGVAQLRTASGIAKPIVRGQYGRRLLLLVDGVRHRAQEWGLDHAPEIDPFVADRLTVVRGAAGVQYGPDAIGGAILVEPPPLLRTPGVAGEAHLIAFTSGHGANVAGRLQQATARWPSLSWQAEGSVRRAAGASTPDYALDNTGVNEWNVGAALGRRTSSSEQRIAYLHYQADLGVCTCVRVETIDDFMASIERGRPIDSELYRSELEIERPYQAVAHDLALVRSAHDWVGMGAIDATLAFQHDHRREYDVVRTAVTGPQFDFRLFTPELELAFRHNPIHLDDHWHLRGSVGTLGVAQIHRYSGLPLIPDYDSWGTGMYAIERLVGHDLEIEAGVRHDIVSRAASLDRQDFLRLVRSGQLPDDACGDSSGDPVECSSTFQTLSASLGALRRIGERWSIKLDLSTASRPPNPDEQYLNGTSPTFPVLGLGKPDLGAETTYSASVTASVQHPRVAAEASAYANRIDDYIYFAPAIDENGDPIFDVLIRGSFPRFVTRPTDASFYGVDAGATVVAQPWLELSGQISAVRAAATDGSYLVFVPPDRAHGTATIRRDRLFGLGPSFVALDGTLVRRQDRFDLAADFAEPPPSYFLLGAEAGTEVQIRDQRIRISVAGSNLTNARYRDYTSLLRYFADQPGVQLMLRLSVRFDSRTKPELERTSP